MIEITEEPRGAGKQKYRNFVLQGEETINDIMLNIYSDICLLITSLYLMCTLFLFI